MKKLNNKGFAISTLIYGVLILFILVMSVLIATLNFRYRSLSDITTRAENQKDKYILSVGIVLSEGEEYVTVHSGIYNFLYTGYDEEGMDKQKICSLYLEKDKKIKFNDKKLNLDEIPLDNCNFEDSDSIIIKNIESTEMIIEDNKSRANMPDLRSGLVPIKYDETKGKWVVTTEDDKDWYNYSEQRWANAASLKEDKRVKDTELNLDEDVYAMFVWIPRFSYTIRCTDINGDKSINKSVTTVTQDYSVDVPTECLGYKIDGASELSTTTPGAIDIKFISSDVKENGIASYDYPDVKNENKDNSWYTHPAFTFGDKELSGIWVGKFETSTKTGSSCYNTTTANCSVDESDIRILPNVTSMRYQKIFNQYNYSRYLTQNVLYGLTGDSHMMKNSEWGAVAYLSQSIYGKYGNNSYSGGYKEIYNNNYYKDATNGYITGVSSGGVGLDTSNSIKCRYDNLIDNKDGKGQCGGGASTTGNIYGIYDMSGGSYEYVMAVYDNNTKDSGFSIEWFNDINNYKYFNNVTTLKPYEDKLDELVGQAIFETRYWYTDQIDPPADLTYPWYIRGHYNSYHNPTNCRYSGVFAIYKRNGAATNYDSFRITLVY